MGGLNISPTKSNLRKVKSDLVFAKEGFDLLEQKREILVIEIMKSINRIRMLEQEFIHSLMDYYASFGFASMVMGSDQVALKSLSEMKEYEISHSTIKFMGIKMPLLSIEVDEIYPGTSLLGTNEGYDICRKRGRDLLPLLVSFASESKRIFLLSRELKRVQRRVNALEKIFIPHYNEAKKYISDRLEEMEREEFFIKKLINQGKG